VHCTFISRINDCPAPDWNRVTGTDHPFTRHEFLAALEHSGSVGHGTGWEPCHLLVHDDNRRLVAVMPLYRKDHSYGEYVFDWSWADAYHRAGMEYYPKLVSAIPFTPAAGPRLAMLPGYETAVLAAVRGTLLDRLPALGASGLHVLFPDAGGAACLQDAGMMRRLGTQFHWLNNGYADFDDFTASFISRKRKTVARERRRVAEAGVEFDICSGRELSEQTWDTFHRFYQLTYARRSGHGGYLQREFFSEVGTTMGEQVVLIIARRAGRPIAGALCFRSSNCLYGRNWGATEDIEFLHFETCYYRGIDYCIEHGLQRFESGAQGEHKIARGFTPMPVASYHWLADPGARRAIAEFLGREEEQVQHYLSQARNALPFRNQAV